MNKKNTERIKVLLENLKETENNKPFAIVVLEYDSNEFFDKNYSKGKSNKDLKEDNEKYQAIKIHSNRIEFRIFSAVPNISTLKWRCDLINLMLKYPTNDVKKAFYYIETRFNSLLSKQYKTKERMQGLKERIKGNSMKFEKVDLSK